MSGPGLGHMDMKTILGLDLDLDLELQEVVVVGEVTERTVMMMIGMTGLIEKEIMIKNVIMNIIQQ